MLDSKSKINDNDGDSSQTSGSEFRNDFFYLLNNAKCVAGTQGDRSKKAPRDSFKGGKPENRAASGNGGGNGGQKERRGKPAMNQPPPTPSPISSSNPSGPQPLMSQGKLFRILNEEEV